jgi:hypothetical protein
MTKSAMIAILILGGTLTARAQVLKVEDISPDQSNFTFSKPGQSDPAGRIKSLVVDPNNDSILYAAAEFSGVWKSTTGALWVGGPNAHSTATDLRWFQSSSGLRNGLTVNQYSLAVDKSSVAIADGKKYSKRLMYATGDNDGRPGNPLGGLWVSLDAAGSWSHVTLCGAGKDGITSVIFAGGQPFVATNCGIWTSTSSGLDQASWTVLTSAPFVLGGAFLADGGSGTFFACYDNLVFRSQNLGRNWDLGIGIGGNCLALAAVPTGTAAASTLALAVHKFGKSSQDVALVDYTAKTPIAHDLGFRSVALNVGSGVSAVAAAFVPSAPPSPKPVPGVTYDIYAADSCAWYGFKPTKLWTMIAHNGKECDAATTNIHADTWAMVFPSWYDTFKGLCAAYAATDGGVFFDAGPGSGPPIVGGCTGGWGPVQKGLHVLESNTVTAITAGALEYALTKSTPLAIYMPTGDNDLFVMDVANCPPGSGAGCSFEPIEWRNFNALGDAGQALVDPAFPNQVLISRNGDYKTVSAPPFIKGAYTGIIPSLPTGVAFDNGDQGTGTGNLTAVMTTATELSSIVTSGDYLAVEDFDPKASTGCSAKSADKVLRNRSGSPPVKSAWVDVSPSDHFLACNIVKVQAAGGHNSLNVYALTTREDSGSKPPVSFSKGRAPGQVYRLIVRNDTPGLTWTSASGTTGSLLGLADNFYVNPYDPSELYAVDVSANAIKASKDAGVHWQVEAALTDIATNHGEYLVGCNGSRGGANASDPFTNGCSISWMAFDVFQPKIRVAAMFYGGIAFSRDGGIHWMALDVTDNNHFLSNNLTEPVAGVFFDGETALPGLPPSSQVIYAGLKGQSLIRVEGPFLTLESANFAYLPTAPATSVSVTIPTLGQTIQLRKDPDGYFRGFTLFEWLTTPPLNYQFAVDGKSLSASTYNLTPADIASGITPPLGP